VAAETKAARAQRLNSATAGLHANTGIPRIRSRTRKAPNPRGMMARGMFGGGLSNGAGGMGFNPLSGLQRSILGSNGSSASGY
jgi:hypothetical protein